MSSAAQRFVNILGVVLVFHLLDDWSSSGSTSWTTTWTSARQAGRSNLFRDELLVGNVNRVSSEPSGGRLKRGAATTTTSTPLITQTTVRIALFGGHIGGVGQVQANGAKITASPTTTIGPLSPDRTTTKLASNKPTSTGPKKTLTTTTTTSARPKTTTKTNTTGKSPTAPQNENSTAKEPPKTTTPTTPSTTSSSPVKPTTSRPKWNLYDAKDVSMFLESHPAISLHDPRAYMTNERFEFTGGYLFEDMQRVIPAKLRFAFVIRMFHEMGRKLASKMNHFVGELVPLLTKSPDEFGGKPGMEVYEGAFLRAINSKDDLDPSMEDGEEDQTDVSFEEFPISSRMQKDKEKVSAFNASIASISSKLAHVVIDLIRRGEREKLIDTSNRQSVAYDLICDSLDNGARLFFDEVASSDKFRVPGEVRLFLAAILRNVNIIIKRHQRDNDWSTAATNNTPDKGYIGFKSNGTTVSNGPTSSYAQMNAISDKQALVGSWNNYLFHNLGTSERVIKLFASLLLRVPAELKSRWINMYMSQVRSELEKTLPTFVMMQSVIARGRGGGTNSNSEKSESYLLSKVADKQTLVENSISQPNENITTTNKSAPTTKGKTNIKKRPKIEDLDRNRLPARCYLAGRRWRFLLKKSMVGFDEHQESAVLRGIVDKVAELKSGLISKPGNEMARLCLPRLEVGLKGWGINGDPHGDSGPNDFPLKNALDNLLDYDDPYRSGVKLGYRIGFKVGYNDKRNATLEMEKAGGGGGGGGGGGQTEARNATKKAHGEATYLARASYRRGATMGARKAFEMAVHEGYLTTLRVSLRAGLLIPSETASRMAALKGREFGGQAGQEAGRAMVNKFLIGKDDLKEDTRSSLRSLGEASGLAAGAKVGELVGATAGKEAAQEAFKRSILRGGRLAKAKWNLDQFEAGARDGFDYGQAEGDRVASSTSLDPSAPTQIQWAKPRLSNKDRREEQPVDHWDRDLMSPLTSTTMEQLHAKRGHTLVRGTLKGTYKVPREVKKSLKRVSYKNVTYNLDIMADGFIDGQVAYLKLEGKVNNFNVLHGSLVATDIFNYK